MSFAIASFGAIDFDMIAANMGSADVIKTLIAAQPSKMENYKKIAEVWSKKNEKGVKIFIDGKLIDFIKAYNVPPVIENGRTLVPLRAISEEFGAEVNWFKEEKMIEISDTKLLIRLSATAKLATVNKNAVELDAPAKVINGRVMIPLRFISEVFDKKVTYMNVNNDLKIIIINY